MSLRTSMLLGTIGLVAGFVTSESIAAEKRSPNFIVVFCDNLGYGDIEPFGSTLHRTPHLNRMAKEGRKFTHFCVTAGVCTPSRASLMTGCYSQRVGMHNNPRDGWVLRPVSQYGLHPDEVTIAEVLKEAGYATGMIGKWHLGDQPEFLPTAQGFDWFFGVPYSDDMTERVWDKDGSKWPPLPLMENETVIEAPCDRDGLTKRYTERAVEWISENKDKPFFLYFPQAMPGSTKTPFSSPEFRGKSQNGPWGDSIEELDWSMGVLMDHLTQLGIAEDTLVIWTSDNGAPINRDPRDLSRGSNLPLPGRGYSTAEGAFRVPTIVWQPGTVPAGTECEELATTMDLLPTFAKLAGADLLERKIDGHDVTALLHGKDEAKSPYDAFFYYQQDQLHAVRSGPWKLFLPIGNPVRHPYFVGKRKPETLLFNLVDDFSCEQNVAEKHPDVVARLTALAEGAREDLGDLNRKGAGIRPIGKIEGEAKPQMLAEKKDGPAASAVGSQNALEMIEGTRGGRHWVDEKTAPPKSPEESLACLEIEPGMKLEIAAAEPIVRDPVAISFDHHGDMYVVEYGDYPVGPEEGGKPLSKIVLLKDTNGDGHMDKRHVFADGLNFAHSMMPYRDGLLVGAQTEILHLKDTDGDHKADVREVLFDGFTPAHPQMQIGNPRWGMDNWIYLNYGPGEVGRPGEAHSKMPRKEVRFNPQTMAIEADSGLGQFGNTIDRWGNRFYCTNRNPIMTTLLSPKDLTRNPFALISTGHYNVGPSGGDTRVYPLVAMKSNYLSHAGTHTSACGVTAYLGDLFDTDFQSSVFVCEPIGHLVTRTIVEPDSAVLKARRAREKADFVASTDTWFRPASLATGPNGALYLADMYRLWVEHPKFLPPEIAAKLDWRAGEDRGRIYRITPEDSSPKKTYSPPTGNDDLVKMLQHPNAWRQQTGQRLIVQRQTADVAPELRRVLRNSSSATARLRALNTLQGVNALTAADVMAAMKDADPNVQRSGLTLSPDFGDNPDVADMQRRLAESQDAAISFAALLTLSSTENSDAATALASAALRHGEGDWFQKAVLISAKQSAGVVLSSLLSSSEFIDRASDWKISLLRQLAAVAGARGDVGELKSVVKNLKANGASLTWHTSAIVSGLGDGLPRHRGDLGRTSLAKLISSPPEELADASKTLGSLLQNAINTALEDSLADSDRVAGMTLAAFLPFSQTRPAIETLLSLNQPAAVQAAAVAALERSGTAGSEVALDRWSQISPTLRSRVIALLLRRSESTLLALQAMQEKRISSSGLSVDQRVRLLKHGDEKIRTLATELLGGAVSANRQAVAKQYEKAV